MEKLVQTYIVAGAVIREDGKYLLVRENRPGTDVHGLWNFPAGRVEEGSTIEETAVKEAKEECGYDVELIRKLDIFQESSKVPPRHAFEAKIVGGELKWPEDEILSANWFSLSEIKEMRERLRGGWILEAINILELGK
jgi:8-oxo-dGTP pyrophosphatase MutT (NUDIX family)